MHFSVMSKCIHSNNLQNHWVFWVTMEKPRKFIKQFVISTEKHNKIPEPCRLTLNDMTYLVLAEGILYNNFISTLTHILQYYVF
jgi:hypothetical protein